MTVRTSKPTKKTSTRSASKASKVQSTAAATSANLPLDQLPIVKLSGVGEKVSAKLASLGIFTVQDVLFHLPMRYQDRTRVRQVGTLLSLIHI